METEINSVNIEIYVKYKGMSIFMTNLKTKREDNTYIVSILYKVTTFHDSKWKNVEGDAAEFILDSFMKTDEHEKAKQVILTAAKIIPI